MNSSNFAQDSSPIDPSRRLLTTFLYPIPFPSSLRYQTSRRQEPYSQMYIGYQGYLEIRLGMKNYRDVLTHGMLEQLFGIAPVPFPAWKCGVVNLIGNRTVIASATKLISSSRVRKGLGFIRHCKVDHSLGAAQPRNAVRIIKTIRFFILHILRAILVSYQNLLRE